MPSDPAPARANSLPPLPLKSINRCWICGGNRLKVIWEDRIDLQWSPTVAPYNHSVHPPCRLARCSDCGFAQPAEVPDMLDYYGKIYHRDWTAADLEKDFQATYRDVIYHDILKHLDRLLPPGKRSLLDIGAHTGRFAWLASQQGWQAEGAEINPATAEFAAARTGLPIHTRRAEQLAAEGKRFDAVTLNDVLEHLPEPGPIVQQIAALLNPGGVLAIKVPHGPMQRVKEWIRVHLMRRDRMLDRAGVMNNFVHVNHFSVGSLRQCLEQAGLTVVSIRPGRAETIPWEQSGLMRGVIVRLFDLAAQSLPFAVHTPVAMNLQAFAIKK